jgi:hypothetical protein
VVNVRISNASTNDSTHIALKVPSTNEQTQRFNFRLVAAVFIATTRRSFDAIFEIGIAFDERLSRILYGTLHKHWQFAREQRALWVLEKLDRVRATRRLDQASLIVVLFE